MFKELTSSVQSLVHPAERAAPSEVHIQRQKIALVFEVTVSHESGPPEEGAELWRAVHSGEPLGLGGAAQRLGEHEDVLERELLTFTDVEAISVK